MTHEPYHDSGKPVSKDILSRLTAIASGLARKKSERERLADLRADENLCMVEVADIQIKALRRELAAAEESRADLLAALRLAVSRPVVDLLKPELTPWLVAARAAIAKAEGR